MTSTMKRFFHFAKTHKFLLGIISLAIIGGVLYINGQKLQAFTGNGKKHETVEVKKGILTQKLTISGMVDADEHVTLRFQTSGQLNWVGVKTGDYVKKYQLLATLDQRELKKKLQKELNDYLSSRWDLDQISKDTYKDLVITDTIKRAKDQKQFSLNNAVLDVEIQDLAIQLSHLTTPIEGFVTRVGTAFAGTNITPSQAEFEIVNPQSVFFSASADQTEVVGLFEGEEGELVLDAFPDRTFRGKIQRISFVPKSGETGTVYEVKFIFTDPVSFGTYRLGMSGDLTVVTKQKEDVLYLPIKFVKQENGKKFVMVIKDKKEEKVYVTTGMETDDDVEIVSPLRAGEKAYD